MINVFLQLASLIMIIFVFYINYKKEKVLKETIDIQSGTIEILEDHLDKGREILTSRAMKIDQIENLLKARDVELAEIMRRQKCLETCLRDVGKLKTRIDHLEDDVYENND